MADEKKTTTIEESAKQAEQAEAEARAEADGGTYTHVFKNPFTYEGRTYEQLTFDWESLSGKDSIDIERDLLRRRITVIAAPFTPEYLAAMAARSCTRRSEEGFRVVDMDMIYAMPLRDFRRICDEARGFLLRAGSR